MNPFELHQQRWHDCQSCDLYRGRIQVVLSRGILPCDVLFIGQAPGKSENIIGDAFAGPAGHEIDRIIQQAFPPRIRVAFTNLVACIPRDQNFEETDPPDFAIKACRNRLKEFVRLAEPRLIVLTGAIAKKWIKGEAQFSNRGDGSIEWLNGKPLQWAEIIHPAAILQSPLIQRSMKRRKCVNTLIQALHRLESPAVKKKRVPDREVKI